FGNLETGDNGTVIPAVRNAGPGVLQGKSTATVKGGVATFSTLGDNTAETLFISFKAGALDPATSDAVNVASAPATHLVVTTAPPDPLTAGQTFTMVVSAEDPYGNVDPSFNGTVTITIPSDPGFTATTQAKNGVATFAGLT